MPVHCHLPLEQKRGKSGQISVVRFEDVCPTTVITLSVKIVLA
jgi:hypothetical protein